MLNTSTSLNKNIDSTLYIMLDSYKLSTTSFTRRVQPVLPPTLNMAFLASQWGGGERGGGGEGGGEERRGGGYTLPLYLSDTPVTYLRIVANEDNISNLSNSPTLETGCFGTNKQSWLSLSLFFLFFFEGGAENHPLRANITNHEMLVLRVLPLS